MVVRIRRIVHSVVKAVGSLLDLAPSDRPLVDRAPSSRAALAGDWRKVGGDMYKAIEITREKAASAE
jgi:hypothetical protein